MLIESHVAAARRPLGTYTNLGILLCEDGRFLEALTVFDKAVEHFPGDCQIFFNRAVVLEELDRKDDALDGYRRCLEIAPDYADAHFNLARLNELRGDKQEALRHYNAYRRLAGLHPFRMASTTRATWLPSSPS